jgi:sec-independent protein translocase protein TatB
MFDIGWGELVVIGVVALIVIGPKELPTVLRTLGHWMTKIRQMASEFQSQFQEAMREAEMADLKKEVESLGKSASELTNFDPLAGAQREIDAALADKPAPAKPDAPVASTSAAQAHAEVGPASPTEGAQPANAAPVNVKVPLPDPVAPVTEEDIVGTSSLAGEKARGGHAA